METAKKECSLFKQASYSKKDALFLLEICWNQTVKLLKFISSSRAPTMVVQCVYAFGKLKHITCTNDKETKLLFKKYTYENIKNVNLYSVDLP